jgi:hypothetical protein
MDDTAYFARAVSYECKMFMKFATNNYDRKSFTVPVTSVCCCKMLVLKPKNRWISVACFIKILQ